MKLFTLLLGAVLVLLVGGFAWLAVTDVPVSQTQVTKTIPNDRFFNNH